jgi:hypothetical protein
MTRYMHRRHRDLLILAVIGLAISGAAKWAGWW